MALTDSINVASLTDVGRVRDHNEDTTLVIVPPDEGVALAKGILAVVADGMGGFEAGEVASSTAADVFARSYYASAETDPVRALRIAASTANSAVREIQARRVGTTLVAVAVIGDTGYVANVGDSRAYLVSPDGFRQVSADHSWVMDQVRAGNMTVEQAEAHPRRNVLTRCLGSDAYVDADIFIEKLCDDCAFVLCSDGLHGLVSDKRIAEIVRTSTPQRAAMMLIELANRNGGHDNISVAILRRGKTTGLEAGFSTVKETKRGNGGWVAAILLLAAIGVFALATQTSRVATSNAAAPAKATSAGLPSVDAEILLDSSAMEKMDRPEVFVTAPDGTFWVLRGGVQEGKVVLALGVSREAGKQREFEVLGDWPPEIRDAAIVGRTLWVTSADGKMYRAAMPVKWWTSAEHSISGTRVSIPADWVTQGSGAQLLAGRGEHAVLATVSDSGGIQDDYRSIPLDGTYSDFVPSGTDGRWVGLRTSSAAQSTSATITMLGRDFRPVTQATPPRATQANRLTLIAGTPFSFTGGASGAVRSWPLRNGRMGPNGTLQNTGSTIWLAPGDRQRLWELSAKNGGYVLAKVGIK